MALVDSLLSAIVRADGDALVMHVGERPYVVVGTQTINISTHGLNLDAMTGMLGQLLPAEAQTQLAEYGAVEHRIPQDSGDRFTVVAARDADDIWIEIRRRRPQPVAAAVAVQPPVAAPVAETPVVMAPVAAIPMIDATVEEAPVVAAPVAPPIEVPVAQVAHVEPAVMLAEPEVIHVESEPMVILNAQLEPLVVAAPDAALAESITEPEPQPVLMPIAEAEPDTVILLAVEPEPEVEAVLLQIVEPEPEVDTVNMQAIEEAPPGDLFQELEAYAAPLEPLPEIAAVVPEPELEVVPVESRELEEVLVAAPLEPLPEIAAVVPEPELEVVPVESRELEEVLVAAPLEPLPEIAAVVPEPELEVVPVESRELEEVLVAAPLEPLPEIAAIVPEPELEVVPVESRELEPIRVEAPPEPLPEIAAIVPEPELEVVHVESRELEPIRVEAPPEPVAEPIAEPVAEPVFAPHIELAEPEPVPIAALAEAPEPMPIAASIAEPEPVPIAASIAEPEQVPLEPSLQQPQPIEEPARVAASIEQPDAFKPGVVLPMTRTVRIEVPPRTATRAASGIDRLLRVASARGATALFLTSDSRPWIRIEGDLRYLDSEPALSREDVESAILEIAPESGHQSIGKGEATEWIAEFADVGRIRCTTFSDHRGPGMLLRMIATRAATAEQLGLAREVQALATEPQGLVLVAGPRASGKSTLVSALVDLVNRQRAEFVITLERQIRLVHDNKAALVSQREIRGGADDSVAAARAALRESPDILVVDDLVSQHMVPLLLTAASEGLLVLVSITAPSTADAVQRFVELAPPEMRKAVQAAMAESFRGAVAQVLLKKAGGGLIAAREVLLATAPVTRVISEGQLAQLPLALESGRKHGMVSFTDALAESVRSGTVDLREAFRKAPDRNRLLETLKRDGIDTSVVERLA